MTPNIYQQLGLKKVINACGKMTILGVSSVAPEVMQATARAASAFVEIDALVEKTGELVSRYTGAEDSYITSCASAGIAIAVAAAITHGDRARVALMPDSTGMANEVVMLRGHNVDYGAPVTSAIRLGAGVWWKSGQVTSPPLATGECDYREHCRLVVREITPLRTERHVEH
ncbi:transferase [Salmonella enterica subsp. enterica]|uniref:Transferase n=1 Tax=Salmonella enterica I TaxID=59201 RepID=A0A379W0F3_SALET|nr:transferase [Salmonella enterica subsp. enterica]